MGSAIELYIMVDFGLHGLCLHGTNKQDLFIIKGNKYKYTCILA